MLQERDVDLVVLDQGDRHLNCSGEDVLHILGAITQFGARADVRAHGRWAGRGPRPSTHRRSEAQARTPPDQAGRQMYDETDKDGKRKHTVARIATASASADRRSTGIWTRWPAHPALSVTLRSVVPRTPAPSQRLPTLVLLASSARCHGAWA
jgi:hypothetical protein